MSHPKKYSVCLTEPEREALQSFASSGQKKAREITHARILLLADSSKKDGDIIELLGLSRPPIVSMRKQYAQGDYAHILDLLLDAPRSGQQVDSRIEAKISMIACSDPPQGGARWNLHLIADRLVQLECIDSISHERIRQALKKPIEAVVE